MKYPEILKLFGTPLSGVPKPKVPFKLKGWHIVVGLTVLGFAGYGFYCAVDNARKGNMRADNDKPNLD